jgi:hypothetical protein
MLVIKVLKRKDASSLILGVAVALFVLQFVTTVTQDLSSRITFWQWGSSNGGYGGPPNSAKVMYLQPLVALVLQLIALEVVVRVYVWLHQQFGKNW